MEKQRIMFENKVWEVDLKNRTVDIVNPDGSTRPATKNDGNFMDVLNEGKVID